MKGERQRRKRKLLNGDTVNRERERERESSEIKKDRGRYVAMQYKD